MIIGQLNRMIFFELPKNFLTTKAITGTEKRGKMKRKTPILYFFLKLTIFLALRRFLELGFFFTQSRISQLVIRNVTKKPMIPPQEIAMKVGQKFSPLI